MYNLVHTGLFYYYNYYNYYYLEKPSTFLVIIIGCDYTKYMYKCVYNVYICVILYTHINILKLNIR